MKTIVKIVAFLCVFLVFSCDNDNGNIQDSELQDTKWKVIKIVEKTTAEETLFPAGEKNFELIFKIRDKFQILNGCNYSYGKYEMNGTEIYFTEIGPATMIYCEPIDDFEDLFIRALGEIKNYKRQNNQLILISDKNEIILEYVETNKGTKN